ncbi:alanine racemase [Aureimonas populi]|uniref:Alanine racemase n=1 Tax=Aureimonas populi TaxID=1701758 RepID=A0ABW5CFP3_9HYPH|nr:alanine racemase [Aureimonas populi]
MSETASFPADATTISTSLHAAPAAGRRPFVEIDSWALKANWRSLAMASGRARTAAAVKADAYGLGVETTAKALFGAGCRDFFVAYAEEGASVREAMPGKNFRVFVLQGLDPQAAAICRRHRLIPVLSTPQDIATWQETAAGELPGVCALQLETGMNRLGLDEAEAKRAARLAAEGKLDLALVMSHLASADDRDGTQSQGQLERFQALTAHFPHVGRSLANSAGTFLDPSYHFDLTRPGIALYGGAASLDPDGSIRPVVTLKAHILQLRWAAKGQAVGYGASARLARRTRVATIGLGYADGLPRCLSGRGAEVFAAGRRAPILGRISMDLTTVDVTDIPEDDLAPGDTVEVFGPNIPIDETAERAGTIGYELLTSLGPRVSRNWR